MRPVSPGPTVFFAVPQSVPFLICRSPRFSIASSSFFSRSAISTICFRLFPSCFSKASPSRSESDSHTIQLDLLCSGQTGCIGMRFRVRGERLKVRRKCCHGSSNCFSIFSSLTLRKRKRHGLEGRRKAHSSPTHPSSSSFDCSPIHLFVFYRALGSHHPARDVLMKERHPRYLPCPAQFVANGGRTSSGLRNHWFRRVTRKKPGAEYRAA